MWDKIKSIFGRLDIEICLAFFLLVWLTAWVLNAVKGMHFDMDKLTELYKWIVGQYATKSLLNTSIPFVNQIKQGGQQQ